MSEKGYHHPVQDTVFERWRARVERGLARLAGNGGPAAQRQRFGESLDQSRRLAVLETPLARLFNGLGELSLSTGFQVLALILFRRARGLDPRDPLPVVNVSRARLSLANRFLLRAPASGAVAYNLGLGREDLDTLLGRARLPEARLVEATVLKRRIEDRLELWKDIQSGEVKPAEVREILRGEDRELRPVLTGKLPSLTELEKLEPARTGFYYRQYRERQKQHRERRPGQR
ncbi:hypothetical protein LLH00_00215 [bacterium]|nr:hypothetical protein [bacterium]